VAPVERDPAGGLGRRRLARGLVRPRGRKAYRITDAGLAEVRRWLAEDEVDHTVRMDTLLRSFFFWLMEPGDLDKHLDRELRHFEQTAQAMRAYAAAKDRGEWGTSPQTRAMRIAVEAAARVNEALAEWARWARENNTPEAEDFGTAPDSPASQATAKDGTAKDGTAKDSTAKDSTAEHGH